jgi:BMFP domain-containing protein YqiC
LDVTLRIWCKISLGKQIYLHKNASSLFQQKNAMKSIHDFIEDIEQHLPKGELIPRQDLKRLIESAARRLDLVTREEFDAQTAVLHRTRQLLEELETKIALMEKN